MAGEIEKERHKEKKEFGRRLRTVLEALGIRQRLLASKLSFSPGYVNDVLQGRTRPSLTMLTRLRTIYNVSPSFVILGEGPMFMPIDLDAIEEEPGNYGAAAFLPRKSPRDALETPLGLTGYRELTRAGHPWITELLDVLPEPINAFLDENPSFRKQFDPICSIMLEEIEARTPERTPGEKVKLAVELKRAFIKLFETAFRLWSSNNEQKLNYLLKSLDAF